MSISGAVLREHVEAGESVAGIGRALGVHASTVRRYCAANGIDLPARRSGPSRKLPPLRELLDRLQSGETPTTIARESKVSRAAVIRALNRDGWHYVGDQINIIGDAAMPLDIVPLISAVRRFGLHRALDYFGINIPTADAFLTGHGFRINDTVTDIEIDCMSVPGMSMPHAVAHVHDVKCRVDAALGGRS